MAWGMNESMLEKNQSSAKALKINLYTAVLASYADETKQNLHPKLWRQSMEFLNLEQNNMPLWPI